MVYIAIVVLENLICVLGGALMDVLDCVASSERKAKICSSTGRKLLCSLLTHLTLCRSDSFPAMSNAYYYLWSKMITSISLVR